MRFSIIILVVLLLISCSSKENSTYIEMVDGIEIIKNSELPLETNKSIKFNKEYTLDTENDSLYSIYAYTVNPNGDLFINDLSNKKILLYNSKGEFVKYVGREGAGPGEFTFINKMDVLPDGNMIINDQGVNFNVYDREGNFVKKINSLGSTSRVMGGKSDYYLISDTSYIDFRDNEKSSELRDFCEFNFKGRLIRKIYSDKLEVIEADKNNRSVNIINNYAFDASNKILYKYNSKEYLIEAIDIDGNTIRKISRPYEPVRYSSKEIEEKKQYYLDLEEKYPGMGFGNREISTKKKVIVQILIDGKSNLWLKTSETKTENNIKKIAYDIFNKKGIYEYRLWIDADKTPHKFINGKMYCKNENEEEGIETLTCYEMVMK